MTHAAPTQSGLVCPTCGYNLTALTSNHCPECGRAFIVSAQEKKKHPMRSLGEVVGLLWRKVQPSQTTIVRKDVAIERHGDVILRRTTIEEIEVRSRS